MNQFINMKEQMFYLIKIEINNYYIFNYESSK
jgi:hypothetical protein